MSGGPFGRGAVGRSLEERLSPWAAALAVVVIVAVAALTARALGGADGGPPATADDRSGEPAAEHAQAPARTPAPTTALRSARPGSVEGLPGEGPVGVVPSGGSPGAVPPFLALPQEDDGPPYDGRFTFLRVRFEAPSGMRGGFFGRRGGGGREPLWAHDMPRAERNFAQILSETTLIDTYTDGGRVLGFEDPELFRYPVAYIVEVGGWRPSELEIANLRAYLLKGGFLIVDDFRGNDIYAFLDAMRRVLPDHEVVEIPDDHEIFDSFFRIDDPHALAPPTFQQYVPMYLGIFEDNDPAKRLMAVVNYNNDIAEYWEYSDWGYFPIDLSNEAYKFGVNYVVYALTH